MLIGARKSLTVLVCVLTTAPALAAERTFDRHFSTPQCGQLKVDTDVGAVVVAGREGHDIGIHADISGSTDFLSRLDVKAVQGAEGVTVTGRIQPRSWFDSLFEFGRNQVLFTINLPHDCPIDIQTAGGRLDIRHLNASVRGKTSGGSITIRDVRGSIDARTSGGHIDAADLNGPTRLHTSGGSIQVSDSTGDLDVSSSGGGIHLDRIDGKARAVTSGGRVEAQLRANRGISLATSGGSIGLLLPADAHGFLDARTSGGEVESQIPMSSTEIASRRVLRGSINGGGEPILLRTSGGSIHVGPLD